jgi:N12 class adenine-specific DNA methylase
MVISAIGRMAAKAAIKKISDASAKKARAVVKADLKKIDSKAIEAMKTAEGTKESSRLFNKKSAYSGESLVN